MSTASLRVKHYVCRAVELPTGERKIIEIDGRSIGVFNVAGEFFALRNLCPHQFAPLCLGKITGYCAPSRVGEYNWKRVGEIIRCPWHAWEFDIKTGRSVFNPHKVRTKSYDVCVDPAPPNTREAGNSMEEKSVETFSVSVDDDAVYVMI